jgi:hypothetical protein
MEENISKPIPGSPDTYQFFDKKRPETTHNPIEAVVHDIRVLRRSIHKQLNTIEKMKIRTASFLGLGFYRPAVDVLNSIYEANKELMIARAWLGDILAGLGQNNPYKHDYRTTSEIEPIADSSDDRYHLTGVHLEDIQATRVHISSILLSLEVVKESFMMNVWPSAIGARNWDKLMASFTLCQVHLKQSRFHLGYELGRLRDNK